MKIYSKVNSKVTKKKKGKRKIIDLGLTPKKLLHFSIVQLDSTNYKKIGNSCLHPFQRIDSCAQLAQLQHIGVQDHYFFFKIFLFLAHNGSFHFLNQLNNGFLHLGYGDYFLNFELLVHLTPWSHLRNGLYNLLSCPFM